MLLITDLDDVESLDIDEFVFGLRVAFVAGAKVVINKGAEDDLGGLYPHFRSERHGSKDFAAELRSGQGPRKANISSSPFLSRLTSTSYRATRTRLYTPSRNI